MKLARWAGRAAAAPGHHLAVALLLMAGALMAAGCNPNAKGTPDGGAAIAPAALSYSQNPAVFALGKAIAPEHPANDGGAITSYAIAPGLPAGLSLSASTGVISGTPTALVAATRFQVTGSNSAGSAKVALSLTVADKPSVSYAGSAGTVGTYGSLMTVTPSALAKNNAPVTGCGVKAGTAALPAGLSVDPASCVVSGTPTAVVADAGFTVVATNAIGTSADAPLLLTINPAVPTLSYAGATGTTVNYGAALSVAPTTLATHGAAITGCALTATSPALPPNVSLNSTTCVISGNPTPASAGTVTYSVVATNSAGAASPASVTLTVSPLAPSLSYASSTGTSGTWGSAMTVAPSTLAANGAALTGCAADVATPLPTGLTVDGSCNISGTPKPATATTGTYNIIATNSAGSTSAPVTLTVSPIAPALSYATSTGTTGNWGSAMSIAPSTFNADGATTTCAASAATPLPTGLVVDNSCNITGAPKPATASTASYTLVATNSAGSTSASVTITVNPIPPSLSYTGASGTNGKVGTAMLVVPTTLNPDGTPITGCAVSPPLPPGLSLGTTNCQISGTPTASQPTTTYTVTASNSAGTSPGAAVSLTIIDVPTLSYANATGTTGVYGQAMSISPTVLQNHGSAITNCAVKSGTTALPAGLSVNATTCVVFGTPTATVSGGTYLIDATNGAGTSPDATLTLTINPAPPSLSYASGTTTGTYNTALTITPTLSANGAALSGCAIKPGTSALPAGLAVNPATCVISGTPTAAAPAAAYVVVATNSAGSSPDAYVSIAVNALAPTLAYANPGNFTAGTAGSLAPTSFAANGAALSGCAPAAATPLPAGLSVDPATCNISGTPSAGAATASYTIVATNSGGSTNAAVTLTVAAGVPTLSYANAANTSGVIGTAMSVSPTTLKANGAAVTNCAITSASPPAWLSVNLTNCVLSGTPSGTAGSAALTVVATNAAGSSAPASVTLSWTAAPAVPTLSYAGATGTVGRINTAMNVAPTTLQNNGSAITGCALGTGSPALPAGLSVNPTTCAITGTPTALSPSATYSVVATNGVGSSSPATVTLEVDDVPALSYVASTGTTGTVNSPMSVTPSTLSSNGSAVTACGIQAGTTPLPSTLTINPTTCVISGTPSAVLAATTYAIVATNALGSSATANVTLTVNAGPPSLSYASPQTATYGVLATITPTSFSGNGAAVTSCTISPPLPTGLSINNSCVISGTPSQVQSATVYTATAVNSVGPTTASFSLTVNPNVPSLSYAGATGTTGTYGTNMTVVPTNLQSNGAAVTGCAIKTGTPGLPTGLSINATTCVISGIPQTAIAATTFTIDAQNSAGFSADATVSLTINALAPTLSYASSYTEQMGQTVNILATLSSNGATPTSCVATPVLPPNLTVDSATCNIGGTAKGTLAPTSYSVVATNSGGSSQPATFTLTVIAPPSVTYPTGVQSALVNQTLTVTPTVNNNYSTITNCTAAPALPVGFAINASTCVITGSSSTNFPATTYTVSATNAAGTSTSTVQIAVRSPAKLVFSDTSPYAFGSVGVGSTVNHPFLVQNTGDLTATAINPSASLGTGFAYENGSYPGFGGTCGTSLAAGASCYIMVTFSPSATGSYTGNLTLAYADGVPTDSPSATMVMNGSGISTGQLTITDWPTLLYAEYGAPPDGSAFDFGLLDVGGALEHTFTVTNTGGGSATVTAASVATTTSTAFSFKGGVFPGAGGSCQLTAALAPNQSCTVVLTFAKPALGAVASSFTLSYSGGASPSVSRSMRGTGVQTAGLEIYDYSTGGNGQGISLVGQFSFGTLGVGNIISHDFLLVNRGPVAATGLSATLNNAAFGMGAAFPGAPSGSYSPSGNRLPYCFSRLEPGASCAVRVTFSPGDVVGYTGTLQVTDSAGDSASRALQGSGTQDALLTIVPENSHGPALLYDYGALVAGTGSATVTFIVSNVGVQQAQSLAGGTFSTTAFTYPTGAFPGGSGSYVAKNGATYPYCGTTLAAKSNCAVTVTFAPAGAGTFQDNLTLSYTDGSAAALSAKQALQGEGTSQPLVVMSCDRCGGSNGPFAPVDELGYVPTGSTAPTTYAILTNNGATAATLSAGSLAGASDYAYTGGTYPGGTGTATVNRNGTPTSYPYCASPTYSLAANSSCVVELTYTPAAAAASEGTLLTVNTGASSSVQLPVSATTTGLGIINLQDCTNCGGGGGGMSTHNFGTVTAGATVTQTFFVTNTGAASATLSDGAFVGSSAFAWANGGTFPGASGPVSYNGTTYNPCSTTTALSPGQTCAVVVAYTGVLNTTSTAEFNILLSGATASNVGYIVTGYATNAAIVSINCPGCRSAGGTMTYDFGYVQPGSSHNQYFYLQNTGASAATLSDGATLAGQFSYTSGTFPGGTGAAPGTPYNFCTPTLYPNTTCVVEVTYVGSTAVQDKGTLTVNMAGATSSSVSVNLQGEPTTLAVVSMSQCAGCGTGGSGTPTENLGYLAPGTYTEYFYLTNNGASAATLSNGGVTGAGYAWANGGVYPGFAAGTTTVALNGQTYNVCGTSLAAGATCVVAVSLTATSGTQSGTATVNLGNATATSVSYNLTANVTTQAILSISTCGNCGTPPVTGTTYTTGYDFGTVVAGSSHTQYFFIQNSGQAPATLTPNPFTGTAFSWAGGSYPGGTAGSTVSVFGQSYTYCPASGGSLNGGATCVVQVAYTASSGTQDKGGFTVTAGGAVDSTVGANLQGEPTTQAILQLASGCANCGGTNSASYTPTYDFGSVADSTTPYTEYFFLTNSGASAATISNQSISGGPAFAWAGPAFPGGNAGSPVLVNGQTYSYCPMVGGTLGAGQTCVMQVAYTASGTTQQRGQFSLSFTGATVTSLGFNLQGEPTNAAIVTLSTCPGCGSGSGSGTPTYDFGTVASGGTFTHYFFLSNRGLSAASLSSGGFTGTQFSWANGGVYPGFAAGTTTVNYNGTTYNVCGATLASNQTCILDVQYVASSAAQDLGSFSVALTGATVSSVGYNLQGEPTTLAIIQVTDCPTCGNMTGTPTLNFGTVASGSTYYHQWVIENTGAATGTVTAVSLTGSTEFSWGSSGFAGGTFPGATSVNVNGTTVAACPSTFPFTLAASASCGLSIAFAASGNTQQLGAFSFSLTGATAASVGWNLQGQPTTSAIVNISDCPNCGTPGAAFQYGTSGIPISRIFYVNNTGVGSTTLSPAGLTLPFEFTGGAYPGGTGSTTINGTPYNFCGSSLAAKSVCVISVTFQGTISAVQNVTLNLGSASTASASRAVQGDATTSSLLVIQDGYDWFSCSGSTSASCPSGNLGTWAINTASAPKVFVVGNRGAVTANLGKIAIAASFFFGSAPPSPGFPGGTGTVTTSDGVSVAFCPAASIPSGTRCAIEVYFDSATAGTFTGPIDIPYSDSTGVLHPDAAFSLTATAQ